MEEFDAGKEESGEDYDENADEDFNPEDEAAKGSDNSSSSEDEPDAEVKPTKRAAKRKSQTAQDDLDSGDEATIKERKSKKRRKNAADDEESGGEGGFIRTRAQRLVEKEERRNRKRGAREGAVTIDVDKIWADLSSIPVNRTVVAPPQDDAEHMEVDAEHEKENAHSTNANDVITIKRKVKFAGELREIEEQVSRSSKEARKYLADHPEADPDHQAHGVDLNGLQRPLKRPSMFEPNPSGLVKGVPPEKLRPRAPTRLDVLMAQKRAEAKASGKMSTVQMSQHDWKAYVAQSGYQEELEKYEKSDARFLAKEAFLDRAAGAREQAARDARMRL
ncbi:uncharacterized protein MYCFIDRAFT_151318 [Pseudocercospora fijiensis CIRAD86]|uniref:SWR1-complex protein 5 n=1 Tax=Pseudocercospora fijiensis (strain CIRAD86) TaxID=383855 RepID=M3BAN9_PSEFD|nr:uncharacterized protein MYCFIDRAFT_151318 [Pseudocercospora fijiensis CIRAD86]EME86288.1 hypothetical protein MYCFIDRAFT_151318 [Pseudocercospora fijiensis CIRAD86]